MVLSRILFLVVVALIAVQRVMELARSRGHIAALRARGRIVHQEPEYAAMVAVHTAVLVAAPIEVFVFHRPLVPTLAAIALVALVFAQLVRAWIFRTLGSAWSTRVVQPVAVVTSGPYRLVRHPNYAIVVLELAALPLVHTAWVTAIVVSFANALVLARRIAMEERVLARDPAWVDAFSGLPRLFPWRGARTPPRATRTAVT